MTYNNRGPSSRGPRRGGGNRRRRYGKKQKQAFDPTIYINKNPVEQVVEEYVPQHTFSDFGMDLSLVNTLRKMGITTPSPIQDQVINHVMAGKDVVGLAETGTGKTAAFLLPLIHTSWQDHSKVHLILAPTRELAIQINEEFRKLSVGMRLFSTMCVGGMPAWQQLKHLKKPNDFIIGTPGRVKDFVKRNKIAGDKISTVVLDEADRMLDMGFIEDMRYILGKTPVERQTLFFSATMTREAQNVIHDFLRDPEEVSVKKKDTADSIEQDVVVYREVEKFTKLQEMVETAEFSRVIVFVETKINAADLSDRLVAAGIEAQSIHGDKEHRERQLALKQFKTGEVKVLVATDVAARGIHVDDVSHVINYDLPGQFEDYVHRIGRTGRGSKRGKALTFVPQDHIEQSGPSRGGKAEPRGNRPVFAKSENRRAPKPNNVLIRKI